MTNPLVELVLLADQRGWCTRRYCTTCGNRDIRARLDEFAQDGGWELARMLSELKPSEITSLPNWDECVSLAFLHCLPWPGQHEMTTVSMFDLLSWSSQAV